VVSAASEVFSSVSFQNAPPRSARSEQGSSDNSFAALVDSNTTASASSDRFQDTPPAPSRRADDPPPAADTRSRGANSASDNPTQRTTDDRTTATGQRGDDTDDNVAKTRSTKSKSTSKSDETKSKEKSASSDDAAASDQAKTDPDSPAAATANAVAAAIPPVTTATDGASSTTPPSDRATAPLATAAAAVAAASSATGNAATGALTPAGTETGATATATVAKAAGAKIDAQAAAAEAAGAQGTAADATMPNGISVAAYATPQLAPKAATAVKGPVVAKEGTTLPGEPNSANGTAQAAASSTPTSIVPGVNQPDAVSGKPKAQDGAVDAMKADASNNAAPVPVANAAANAHAAAADAAQTLANPPNAGTPAANAIQPQLSSAPTAPTPTTQLNITTATHAAVPLSGLAMEIAASAKSGKSRFEIRLDPAELGRIDVRIDVDGNGRVTSHLTVDRPETLSMLRQDATQLQRALDNAGLQTGNGGLQFSLRDQSSQGQNDGSQSNPNAHRLIVTEEDTILATVARRSYGRLLGTSGGVDISV